MTTEPDRHFEDLLEFLKRSRSFDFTGYKRSTLTRRILHRMQMVNVHEYADYVDYLEVHPEEFISLFNTILINVTSFFRDSDSWDFLSSEVLPRLIAAKTADMPVRAWSAGCASGEEAYTIAILLAELLGMDAFREQVKIYATDVDEDALSKARAGVYSDRETAGVPPAWRDKYFERSGDLYTVRKDLRRAVIFGRHDLVQDAPISRIDLLTCRNTLMYFNSETQHRILSHLAFALNDGGTLFLGKAEMLYNQLNYFTPLDLKHRVFTRLPGLGRRDRSFFGALAARPDFTGQPPNASRLVDVAFEADQVAQLAVDTSGSLILANARARELFGLSRRDIGRLLQDMEVSYRPVELRSLIEQAVVNRQPVSRREIAWTPPALATRWFDIEVVPLMEPGDLPIGVRVLFQDVTLLKRLREELEQSKRDLELAYEELQSTNEELQTTNEELQSTIEELETTNEELQSTNEELETMNEELQSTNQEMDTTNQELRQQTLNLDRMNVFLESILRNLHVGVVVIDRDLRVQLWNDTTTDLWGLRADEVQGKNFMALDIGLPVEQLGQAIRASLSSEGDVHEVTVRATNRRGKAVVCRVECRPIGHGDSATDGVLLLMTEKIVRVRRKAQPV